MICHLSLFRGDESGPLNSTSGSSVTNQPHDLLYGSLVSSPQVYRDLHGRQGIYFLFPDVSIRTRGQFQMRISLIRLPRYVYHRFWTCASASNLLAWNRLQRSTFAVKTTFSLKLGQRRFRFCPGMNTLRHVSTLCVITRMHTYATNWQHKHL